MSYTDDLEEKIFDLEARFTKLKRLVDKTSIGSIEKLEARLDAAEKSLRLLALDYRKQRAVNEAQLNGLLMRHGTMDEVQGDDERIAALREALE